MKGKINKLINIGEYNLLQVKRKAAIGYYLDGKTHNSSDDILLPNKSTEDKELEVGQNVEAFIYRDSSDRIIATLKKPLATVGELKVLKVVSNTKIGSFIDIGLERDILVPFHEQSYNLVEGNEYLFYIYLDKTGRIAASTRIDSKLFNAVTVSEDTGEAEEIYKPGTQVTGIVYGIQSNDSVMVAIDNKYRGVILKKEYYTNIVPGEILTLHVKKYYNDNKMELTPRNTTKEERSTLEEIILEYLEDNNGKMIYNDKSSPEEIKRVFHESKNVFKKALGGLMKKRLIDQDETGTWLVKNKE